MEDLPCILGVGILSWRPIWTESLTLLSVHSAAAGPAFVSQNYGVYHPLFPVRQGHPLGALGLEVVRCTSPEEDRSSCGLTCPADCLLVCGLREGRGGELGPQRPA